MGGGRHLNTRERGEFQSVWCDTKSKFWGSVAFLREDSPTEHALSDKYTQSTAEGRNLFHLNYSYWTRREDQQQRRITRGQFKRDLKELAHLKDI